MVVKVKKEQVNLKVFGENIRRRRISMGYSQWDLAEEAGIAKSLISMYETGKRGLALKTLFNLARVFQTINRGSSATDLHEALKWRAIYDSIQQLTGVRNGNKE